MLSFPWCHWQAIELPVAPNRLQPAAAGWASPSDR